MLTATTKDLYSLFNVSPVATFRLSIAVGYLEILYFVGESTYKLQTVKGKMGETRISIQRFSDEMNFCFQAFHHSDIIEPHTKCHQQKYLSENARFAEDQISMVECSGH